LGELYESAYNESQYDERRAQVVRLLSAEEANFQRARDLSCTYALWQSLLGSVRGLITLYEYKGQSTKLTTLINDTVPYFSDPATDGPLIGREEQWSTFNAYRVRLAVKAQEWTVAERLQAAAVAWYRDQLVSAEMLSEEALRGRQRTLVLELASSLNTLGDLLLAQRQADCIAHYREANQLFQGLGERRSEASVAYNLSRAFLEIPEVRDPDQAQLWCRRSLELQDEEDKLGRARTLTQLGYIAYERFHQARDSGAVVSSTSPDLWEARDVLEKALELLPSDKGYQSSVIHNELGMIYSEAEDLSKALMHYRESVRFAEVIGDRRGAGIARSNAAIALYREGRLEDALSYAESALHDYEMDSKSSPEDIGQTRELIAWIQQGPSKMRNEGAR
jgi:tetratricopeptide (TPR) repeat protein